MHLFCCCAPSFPGLADPLLSLHVRRLMPEGHLPLHSEGRLLREVLRVSRLTPLDCDAPALQSGVSSLSFLTRHKNPLCGLQVLVVLRPISC